MVPAALRLPATLNVRVPPRLQRSFPIQVTVTADAAANALVVSAAPKDWESLLKVIAEIDVPRTQVFLQAIVVEVSPERQRNLGVRFSASESPADNALGLGTINFVNLQDAIGSPLGLRALGPGLAAGSLCVIPAPSEAAASGAVMVNGNSMAVPCDIALIEALKSDPQSRVLSAPTLLTADNTEASIVIGRRHGSVRRSISTGARVFPGRSSIA